MLDMKSSSSYCRALWRAECFFSPYATFSGVIRYNCYTAKVHIVLLCVAYSQSTLSFVLYSDNTKTLMCAFSSRQMPLITTRYYSGASALCSICNAMMLCLDVLCLNVYLLTIFIYLFAFFWFQLNAFR